MRRNEVGGNEENKAARIAWIIFLAAVCALAATVLQSVRKAEQEFPMAGKNVSQLDTEQILTHIRKAQRCGKNTAFLGERR